MLRRQDVGEKILRMMISLTGVNGYFSVTMQEILAVISLTHNLCDFCLNDLLTKNLHFNLIIEKNMCMFMNTDHLHAHGPLISEQPHPGSS